MPPSEDWLNSILRTMSVDTVRTWEDPKLNQAATVKVWMEARAAILAHLAEAIGSREGRPDIPDNDDEEKIATDLDVAWARRIGAQTGRNALRAELRARLGVAEQTHE